MTKQQTQEIFQKYFAMWVAYYSKKEFCGQCPKVAAEFATLDCMNVGKNANWTEADYLDDLQYWSAKAA
jgi:hypothetical protein